MLEEEFATRATELAKSINTSLQSIEISERSAKVINPFEISAARILCEEYINLCKEYKIKLNDYSKFITNIQNTVEILLKHIEAFEDSLEVAMRVDEKEKKILCEGDKVGSVIVKKVDDSAINRKYVMTPDADNETLQKNVTIVDLQKMLLPTEIVLDQSTDAPVTRSSTLSSLSSSGSSSSSAASTPQAGSPISGRRQIFTLTSRKSQGTIEDPNKHNRSSSAGTGSPTTKSSVMRRTVRGLGNLLNRVSIATQNDDAQKPPQDSGKAPS
jgi:hypothetical protein